MGETFKEDEYESLSHHEHILERPGMYVGSMNTLTEDYNVFDENTNKIISKKVTYVPAFIKIFDEVLVNAIDHSIKFTDVTSIDVTVDKETNVISVKNNGPGIPIKINEKKGIYNPEMIFGNLLTSSSFQDDAQKITGSINGMGAKLTNIYSTNFKVETVDSQRQLYYKQEFSNNMYNVEKPTIKKYTGKSYTKITYSPDLKRFKLVSLTDDIYSILQRRVYDTSACTNKNVKVTFNGTQIKQKDFVSYTELYFDNRTPDAYEKIELGEYVWEIAVYRNEDFKQVSFVNGLSTIKGGKHIEFILKQISKKIIASLPKLENIKQKYIEDHIFLFVRATINEPDFDSQTKEFLKTPYTKFFFDKTMKLEISDKFIKKLSKSGLIEDIIKFTNYKNQKDLVKTTQTPKKSKILGIPKLDDANAAGTKNSEKCSLIIVEGDSAKAFAKAGRAVIENGNDYFGVFPIKGVILNVREATFSQQKNNETVNDIIKILGLTHGKKYTKETLNELRYGRVIILTDQDYDGDHITGLFMNLFEYWWPGLIEIPGFLSRIATPIVKVTHGKKIIEFFKNKDYLDWYAQNKDTFKGTIKYYKGLGTSKEKEAREIFKDIYVNKKVDSINFYSDTEKNTKNAMLLAFDKNFADNRKKWLSDYDDTKIYDQLQGKTSYRDFINGTYIHFSMYDNHRSIPNIIDGLKPSQRKIVFTLIKKNYKEEIKVAQLSGAVSEITSYHHGENSLQQAIVKMAQDFPGSNNWNLLSPNGQFGSKARIGKDAASPRYIFTELSEYSKKIFDKTDSEIIDYIYEEGHFIEPKFYVPIVPIILINGANGIGTGYSTSVPMYNPKDVIENMKRCLSKKELVTMIPYYKGFNGTIKLTKPDTYETYGVVIDKPNSKNLIVNETPLGIDTDSLKGYYEILANENDYGIDSINTNDILGKTEDTPMIREFVIIFKSIKEKQDFLKKDYIKILKLSSKIHTSNMYLFDEKGQIKHFKTPEDILEHFMKLRLHYNQMRLDYLIKGILEVLVVLENKIRFIEEIMDNTLVVFRQKKDIIIEQLVKRKYQKINDGYSYLTNMYISSFSYEIIQELKKDLKKKKDELEVIKAKTKESLLLEDLDNLSKLY